MLYVNLNELLSSFSDQKKQGVFLDKITSRIVKQCYGLNTEFVDAVSEARFNRDWIFGAKW